MKRVKCNNVVTVTRSMKAKNVTDKKINISREIEIRWRDDSLSRWKFRYLILSGGRLPALKLVAKLEIAPVATPLRNGRPRANAVN